MFLKLRIFIPYLLELTVILFRLFFFFYLNYNELLVYFSASISQSGCKGNNFYLLGKLNLIFFKLYFFANNLSNELLCTIPQQSPAKGVQR